MLNASYERHVGSSCCAPPSSASKTGTVFFKAPPKRAVRNADSMLVQELNELSVQERNEIYEDIHGIPIDRHNEPTGPELEKLFQELQNHISEIRKRQAYEKALYLRPSYVTNRKFRLQFLRADEFNAHKAAQRIVKHFECKQELFGDAKLVEDITLDDLTPEDMDCLMSGSTQILPKKDSAGRTITCANQNHFNFKHWREYLRVTWYVTSVALEEEVTQSRGLVNVIVDIRPNHYDFDLAGLLQNTHKVNGLPYRFSAWHYCHNSPRIEPIINLVQVMVGKSSRLRFRPHKGSHLEAIYALMPFGIPQEALPFTASGEMKLDSLKKFIEERRLIERQRKQNEIASGDVYPKPNDVLLGRGRPAQEFSGNLQLKSMIDHYRAEYEQRSRSGKTELTIRVADRIRNAGGRFLQRRDDLQWEEVMDEKAVRSKISHSFRTKTTLDVSILDRWTARALHHPSSLSSEEDGDSSDEEDNGKQSKRPKL